MAEDVVEPDGTLTQVYVYRNPGVDDPDLFDNLARHTWRRYIAFFGTSAQPPDPQREGAIVATGITPARCHRRAVRAFFNQPRYNIKPILVAPLPPVRTTRPRP
jgi:hypothetical protein